jgi:diguanylate cyclase (GGDEF)-like protein/PAS domain S-box-containing protein
MADNQLTKQDLVRELTGLRKKILELENSETTYRMLVDSAKSVIIRIDTKGKVRFFNKFAQLFFGLEEHEVLGKNIIDIVTPEEGNSGEVFKEMIQDIKFHPDLYSTYETEAIRPNGRHVWISWTNGALTSRDGEVTEVICIGSDITERKFAEDEFKRLAHTDILTGLSNRHHFTEKLLTEIHRFNRNHKPFSFIMADIDHFKLVNDTYGHDCGDFVLKKISEVMKDSVRRIDIVGRWGGEEFVMILPETNLTGGRFTAEKVRTNISTNSYNHKNHVIAVTMSFGVSLYDHEMVMDEIVTSADRCLYRAKMAGRNRVVTEYD